MSNDSNMSNKIRVFELVYLSLDIASMLGSTDLFNDSNSSKIIHEILSFNLLEIILVYCSSKDF